MCTDTVLHVKYRIIIRGAFLVYIWLIEKYSVQSSIKSFCSNSISSWLYIRIGIDCIQLMDELLEYDKAGNIHPLRGSFEKKGGSIILDRRHIAAFCCPAYPNSVIYIKYLKLSAAVAPVKLALTVNTCQRAYWKKYVLERCNSARISNAIAGGVER